MLRYIKPLLDTVQNICPSFKLKYWDTDTKIVDKTITYYTKLKIYEGYNTDIIKGSVYIDIWAKNMQDVADAENEIYLALRRCQYTNTENIIIADNISFSDFGKEVDTKLYRANGQIEIKILFITDNN